MPALMAPHRADVSTIGRAATEIVRTGTGAEAEAELGSLVSSGGAGVGAGVDAGVEQAASKSMRTTAAPIGTRLVIIWTSFHSTLNVVQASLAR
jgi:hypothetical protein